VLLASFFSFSVSSVVSSNSFLNSQKVFQVCSSISLATCSISENLSLNSSVHIVVSSNSFFSLSYFCVNDSIDLIQDFAKLSCSSAFSSICACNTATAFLSSIVAFTTSLEFSASIFLALLENFSKLLNALSALAQPINHILSHRLTTHSIRERNFNVVFAKNLFNHACNLAKEFCIPTTAFIAHN